jgi:hypothetical protein
MQTATSKQTWNRRRCAAVVLELMATLLRVPWNKVVCLVRCPHPGCHPYFNRERGQGKLLPRVAVHDLIPEPQSFAQDAVAEASGVHVQAERPRLRVFGHQIRSRQEICTNQLQTIAAGLKAPTAASA